MFVKNFCFELLKNELPGNQHTDQSTQTKFKEVHMKSHTAVMPYKQYLNAVFCNRETRRGNLESRSCLLTTFEFMGLEIENKL